MPTNSDGKGNASDYDLENLNHDMRTPLIGMISFVQQIANKTKSQKIRARAKQLMLATQALLDFQNSWLTTKDVITICDTMNTLFNLVNLNAILKNITLQFIIEPAVPACIITHKKYFFAMLLELLSNAIKFTERGSVILHVSGQNNTQKKCILKIAVIDTGVGIAFTEQKNIFKRFFRIENNSAGSGLGLYFLKKNVTALRGKIKVVSKVGVGSTFTCWIPVLKIKRTHTTYTIKPTIDLKLGAKRIQKDTYNAKEMLRLLLKNIKTDKKNMRNAIREKDWVTAQNVNHQLLGALSYCGAPRLEIACQQLQNALKNLSEKEITHYSQTVLSEIAALQSHSSALMDVPHSKT